MGEQLKKLRRRTPEQEALLRDVRKYQTIVRASVALTNNVKSMFRSGLVSEEEQDVMLTEWIKPLRTAADKHIREAFKRHRIAEAPIWNEWMQHIRGIGETLGIQFIALIQPISDFENVAKLWAYAGEAVKDGRAVRRERGVQSRWSNSLKTLCFQASECFVRLGGPYRDLYDLYRERDKRAHPEPVEHRGKNGKVQMDRDGQPIRLYAPAHMHNRGMRYAVKMFLSHLWQAWRELEGLATPEPYPIEFLEGHTNLLSPWTCIQKTKEANPARREGDHDALYPTTPPSTAKTNGRPTDRAPVDPGGGRPGVAREYGYGDEPASGRPVAGREGRQALTVAAG